jgi:hypothetical protein
MSDRATRRRWLLPGAGSTLAALVIGVVALATNGPESEPANRTAAVEIAAPTPSAATPTPTPTPPRRTPTTPATKKPSCMRAGVVDVPSLYNSGKITVAARTKDESQICPGERIKITWVTYERAADGSSKLYRSAFHYLDRAHPRWTCTTVEPNTCGSSWCVVSGNVAIPPTVPKGVIPFGRAKVHWDEPSAC